MNSYEWKQEQRRLRLERAAARATSEGERSLKAADDAVAGIPFGQPILVGHHSEKRHRAALKRYDDRMRRGCGKLKEAQEYARRAASVGSAGISSDDPDAVEKLSEKLEDLIALRERRKQINAAFRKAKGGKGWTDSLDLTQAERTELVRRYSFHDTDGTPFPAYSLQNLGARIRQAEKRKAQLAQRERVREVLAAEGAAPAQLQVGTATIVQDLDDNRVLLRFPARLSKDHYRQVRAAGFVWSPTRNAFVRQLTNYAVDQAKRVAAAIGGGA